MLLDPKMTQEAKARLRQQYGLDKPLSQQFFIYLKKALRGDFGTSFYYHKNVFKVIKEKLPPTILLFTTATVLSFLLGFALGKKMVFQQKNELPYIFSGLFLYTIFVPWFALLLIYFFSFKLNLFPLAGMITPELYLQGKVSAWVKVKDLLWHLTLPLATLSLLSFPGTMLLTRNALLEVLGEDFILTARALGMEESKQRQWTARAGLLPVITSFALSLTFSLGGGVLTETVFSWPGLGAALVEATLKQDYPLAQAAFFSLAVVVLLGNLLADFLYMILDPRVRLKGASD